MESFKTKTPYPKLGEVLREIAGVFDSRPIKTNDVRNIEYRLADNLDRLAREGDFNYTLIEEMKRRIFKAPFENHQSTFNEYLYDFGSYLVDKYIKIIRNVSLVTYTRNESIPWLLDHYATDCFLQLIDYRQKNYKEMVEDLDLLKDDRPIRSFFEWLELKFPEWVEFKQSFGKEYSIDTKADRDKVWKWVAGKDIPSSSSLWSKGGIFTTFFSEYQLDDQSISAINESLFFARSLEIFLSKTTNYSCFKNMKKMIDGQYIELDDNILLESYQMIPSDIVLEKATQYVMLRNTIQQRLRNSTFLGKRDGYEIYDLLLKAEIEAKRIKQYKPDWWQIDRYLGMWYIYNNDFKKAIPCYMSAIDGFIYSGSENTKSVLKESLAVCCTAYLSGLKKVEKQSVKSFIKRLKSQGSAFGFYSPWTNGKNDIPDIEIKIGASYFWQYFPKEKYFC